MTERSRIIRPFSPFLTSAVAVLLSTSCGQESKLADSPPQKVPKVKVGLVELREFVDEIEALGTVRAFEAIEVSANVTETVVAVSFEDGQTVEKGTVLAQLSSDEEEAMLEGAKINLEEQEREVARLRELASGGAVSKVRLEEYLTARDLALQKIEEAKAKLADRLVVAPFGGVLGFRQVSVGTLVSPGEVLATLDLIDTVKLDFAVPETFLGDLVPGQKIVASSGAYPGTDFEGEVNNIDPRVNPVTRSVVVRAEIPNPDHKLKPGMLLTTRIRKNPSRSPSVPERALVALQSRHSVFLVEDGGMVESVDVQIGRRIPGYVEIVGGVEIGEKIVVDGVLGLRDGAEVNVTGEAQPPASPYSPTGDTDSPASE